jgi:predicted nucleic acid-binding protein
MVKKLTLTLDSKVIEAAKDYARENNMSLSGIVGLYFKSLSTGEKPDKLHPITRELSGIAKFDTKKSDRQMLEEALNKRFL